MKTSLALFLQRYGLTALIACSIAGVVAVIGWETGWARYLTPGAPKFDGAGRKADEIAIFPNFALPPLDPTFKETVERPLFTQARRPNPPAAPVVAAGPAMEKGKYRLTGTSVNAESSTAFLVDVKTGRTLRAVKGTMVDPVGTQAVMVSSVDPTSVVLKLGNDTETLSLSTAKSTLVAQVAPPAGQPVSGLPVMGAVPQPMAPGQPAISPGPQPNVFGPGGPFGAGMGQMPVPLPPGSTAGPVPPAPGSVAMPFPPTNSGSAIPLPPATSAQPQTNDPNSTALRRRRFQNLPQ